MIVETKVADIFVVEKMDEMIAAVVVVDGTPVELKVTD
jgi:hypothetical protein